MASKADPRRRLDHAYEVIRGNIGRLEHSAERLERARLRLVESVARLQQNHDLLTRTVHDDTPE